MDWRNVLFLTCALLLLPRPLVGQGPAATSQSVVTVLGDVARPGRFSVQSQTTVRGAISGATPLSDSVNVTIMRFGQQRAQWTRTLRMSTGDNSERVLDGDVLLVECLSPLQQQPARNAAVRGPTGTTVVSLEDNGVTIGDVLAGLGIPVGPESRLIVSARLRSQPPVNPASLSTVVQHGDVVTLSMAESQVGQSAETADGESAKSTAVRPMFSEWQTAPQPTAAVPAVPDHYTASVGAFGGAGMPGDQFPGNSTVPATPDSVSAEPSAAFAAPTQSLADAGRGGEELLTLEDQLRANPIAGELSTTTGAVATTPRPPVLSDEAAADTVQTETSTAPPGKAVAEAAPAAVTGGGNQLMNGFVIAALLLSGCWVLAKSVTVSQRSSAERPVEAIPLPVSGPVQQAAFVASIVQPQPVVNYPPLPAAVTVPPAPMQQVPMQQVPVPSMAVQPATALASAYQPMNVVPVSLPQTPITPSVSMGSAASLRDGFDDLLRNQVPVEASDLRLPAGVQIYGRPNRPPVLRLDAPQTSMGAPHFAAGGRAVRSESADGSLRGAGRDALQESRIETAAEQRLARLTRPVRGAGGLPRG